MIEPLQVMCVAGILRSLTANCSSLLYAVGRPQSVLRCSAAAALVLPAAFVLLGNLYGMKGIYSSWLFIYPVVGPWLFFKAVSTVSGIPVSTFFANFRAPLTSVLALAAVTIMIKPFLPESNPWLTLALEIAAGASVYVGSYYLFFREDFREAVQLLRQLRK